MSGSNDDSVAKKAKTEDTTEQTTETETKTETETTTTATETPEKIEVDADVARRILAQVEFYFGDANFANDKFLRAEAEKAEGFVPLATLLTFNRLRQLSDDAAVIAQCVAESDVVELSADRLSVKRRKSEVPTDSIARSIVTRSYPDDVTWEQVAEFWNTKVGNVGATRLHRRKGDKAFTGTVFIEFNTTEAADAAVAAAADGTLKFREADEEPLVVQSKENYIAEQREKRKAAAAEAKAAKAAAAGADGDAAAATGEGDGKREIRYTKGCIVCVAGLGVIPGRDDLKAALEPFGDVEYVDYGDEDVDGKVRFSDPDAAQAALDAFAAGTREIFGKVPSLSLLEGDEELAYWTRIVASSDAKKARRGSAGGRRGGRRGGKRRR